MRFEKCVLPWEDKYFLENHEIFRLHAFYKSILPLLLYMECRTCWKMKHKGKIVSLYY